MRALGSSEPRAARVQVAAFGSPRTTKCFTQPSSRSTPPSMTAIHPADEPAQGLHRSPVGRPAASRAGARLAESVPLTRSREARKELHGSAQGRPRPR